MTARFCAFRWESTMLDITPPQYTHVVRLDQPYFKGEMHTLCQLSVTPTPQMLRLLMIGDQLAVSPDGSCVAMVQVVNTAKECVHHTSLQVDLVFDRAHPSSGLGARILEVGNDHVHVWGRTDLQPPGVWRLTAGHAQYLFPIEKFVGSVGQGAARMDIGVSPLYPDELCLLTRDGLWPVEPDAVFHPYAGCKLAVLETFAGSQYGYQLTDRMVTPFQHLQDPRFEPVALVRWQGQLLLVQSSDGGSQITQIGSYESPHKQIRLPVTGRVTQVWSSPQGESIALLVQPRKGSPHRRLYLNSGQLVYQGVFTLTQENLTWSPNGRSFAAVVQVERADGCVMNRIVTPSTTQDLILRMKVKEVLAGDDGAIEGTILTDGGLDFPEVRGGQRTAVPMAWNLNLAPDGAVTWNTVHHDRILLWVDRTAMGARAA